MAAMQGHRPSPEQQAADRPAEAEDRDGAVHLVLPDVGETLMTADAALETAHRLMDAALAAKRKGAHKPAAS